VSQRLHPWHLRCSCWGLIVRPSVSKPVSSELLRHSQRRDDIRSGLPECLPGRYLGHGRRRHHLCRRVSPCLPRRHSRTGKSGSCL
jgi:hypothetical protein